jgi:hypothetical protein
MVGRVACSAGVQFRRLRGAGVVWVGEGGGEVGALAARALRFLRTSETSSVVHSLVHASGAWRAQVLPLSLNDPADARTTRAAARNATSRLRRIAALRPRLACFGHGPVVRDPGLITDLADRLPPPSPTS